MHIDLTAKNLDLTPSIDEAIREKLGSLQKFLKRYEDLGELELRTTVERSTNHHNNGEIFRVSADLVVPKKNLHAEAAAEDLYGAIDEVRTKLHAEIETYRGERE